MPTFFPSEQDLMNLAQLLGNWDKELLTSHERQAILSNAGIPAHLMAPLRLDGTTEQFVASVVDLARRDILPVLCFVRFLVLSKQLETVECSFALDLLIKGGSQPGTAALAERAVYMQFPGRTIFTFKEELKSSEEIFVEAARQLAAFEIPDLLGKFDRSAVHEAFRLVSQYEANYKDYYRQLMSWFMDLISWFSQGQVTLRESPPPKGARVAGMAEPFKLLRGRGEVKYLSIGPYIPPFKLIQ